METRINSRRLHVIYHAGDIARELGASERGLELRRNRLEDEPFQIIALALIGHVGEEHRHVLLHIVLEPTDSVFIRVGGEVDLARPRERVGMNLDPVDTVLGQFEISEQILAIKRLPSLVVGEKAAIHTNHELRERELLRRLGNRLAHAIYVGSSSQAVK